MTSSETSNVLCALAMCAAGTYSRALASTIQTSGSCEGHQAPRPAIAKDRIRRFGGGCKTPVGLEPHRNPSRDADGLGVVPEAHSVV
jgi:hypothetical protein